MSHLLEWWTFGMIKVLSLIRLNVLLVGCYFEITYSLTMDTHLQVKTTSRKKR